jgi:hypothetical protein
MQEATLYIGGFFGGAWALLVLFVAVRSFVLSAQQLHAEQISREVK